MGRRVRKPDLNDNIIDGDNAFNLSIESTRSYVKVAIPHSRGGKELK